MHFEFATASQIIFGPGSLEKVNDLAAGMGKCALVVGGRTGDRARLLREQLSGISLACIEFSVDQEPTVEVVMKGVSIAKSESCDFVIAIGGGSVLDTGKVIAALVTNECDIYDYLEVIGRGKKITRPPLPFIAIPTTAGTGTEVTRNAVIGSPEYGVKVSLRSPMMLPRVAIVDPELTYSLPPPITAFTGLDALTQLIEPYVCNLPNPMVDALALEGIKRAARSLPRAYLVGTDEDARSDMALASLYGGLCLANARLGAVHGFAGPIGGMCPAPHGVICARFLPIVMEANVQALQAGRGERRYLERFDYLARMLTEDDNAVAFDGVRWAYEIRRTLQIPELSTYGLSPSMIPELVENAARSSSMRGNPVQLSKDELKALLQREMGLI